MEFVSSPISICSFTSNISGCVLSLGKLARRQQAVISILHFIFLFTYSRYFTIIQITAFELF